MRYWVTEIKASDPKTGELKTWAGPNVPGVNKETAYQYLNQNGLGYCEIIGELVAEIPAMEGTHEPDFANMIDYEKIRRN